MSIQSTKTVTREWAIWRIRHVMEQKKDSNYRVIENITYEPYGNIREFVASPVPDIEDIEKWTNGMLEELIDEPFFRESLFDNYDVVDARDPLKQRAIGIAYQP